MTSEKTSSGLWLGFIVGAIFGIGTSYFFGTKNGRKTLKEILSTIEDIEEPLRKSTISVVNEIKELLLEPNVKDLLSGNNQTDKQSNLIGSATLLIDKIKGVIKEQK